MVKSVLGANKGLHDWLIQRVTAVVMAIYSTGLLGFFITHSGLEFYQWASLFQPVWMKVATALFVLCLLWHAWIGMWTIFTDYVKPFWLRLSLHTLVLLGLAALFLETLLILWGAQ